MSILDATFFRDEAAAFAKLESVLWPDGPACPHCGVVDDAHKIAANPAKKVRHGLYRCNACKAQFTVTVGTVYERSHIPLHKWLQATYLICSSKKGISAKQIERTLEITYKSAWFMMHRIRAAMDPIYVTPPTPMGGAGKVIEVDETFIGRQAGQPKRRGGWGHKNVVLTLVQRGGNARSFHVDGVRIADIAPVVRENISREVALMTDEASHYRKVGGEFASHETVNHGVDEYVRGLAHTNTVEGYFSIFKRGMKGIYQHCSEKHLARYLAEFDFRYNSRERLGVNDAARTDNALRGSAGKRLTYRE
jgi:transposase-like protein